MSSFSWVGTGSVGLWVGFNWIRLNFGLLVSGLALVICGLEGAGRLWTKLFLDRLETTLVGPRVFFFVVLGDFWCGFYDRLTRESKKIIG
jgi:hypothetical protein